MSKSFTYTTLKKFNGVINESEINIDKLEWIIDHL